MAAVRCPIRLGAGVPRAEVAQPEAAQCEISSSSSAATSAARSLGPKFEIFGCASVQGQSGGRSRDRPLERSEVGVPKQELEKAQAVSMKPPIDVEVEQCRKFIVRAVKWVAELDAERAAESGALHEAKGRLQRWEAEQAAATSFPDPSVPLQSPPDCAEIVA